MKNALLISCCLLSPLVAGPTHLYLANDDYTDFMWTADEATYERVFQEMIDFHLDLTEKTKGQPPAFQNRFNLDGSYWLWVYQKKRSPEEFARVIAALKSGHFSAPLNTLVSCYGGQPAEAVLRGMNYAGLLERKHGLRFTQAVANENRTLPLGLNSLWAGSGAKYSWRGICKSASRVELSPRDHEIFWSFGPDGQRVLMKWHTWCGMHDLGGYGEAFDPRAAVEKLDGDPEFLRRYRAPAAAEPYSVRGAFGFGWDALDRKTGQPYLPDPKGYPQSDHFHQVAGEMTTPKRQVFVSNQEDFFRDFESKYGNLLPTESVTSGNQWDLYSASMAETSSRVRRAVEKLRAAEALAAIVSTRNPDFLHGREASRDLAFSNLGLYWEHDWTADGPVSREVRAAWQERLAAEIESYVNTLHADAQTALGGLIATSGGDPQFYVFNPLGWTRTDAADFPYDGPADIHVHDLSAGADTPHQIEKRDGKTYLRILARDLPSAGYKVFAIRSGPGTGAKDLAANASGRENREFENSRVKLQLDTDGSILGFFDKARPEHNLAARIDGLALNDFSAVNSNGDPRYEIENAGPVSVTLKCSSDAGRNHITRITLLHDSDRVEIRNDVTEAIGDLKHWAFSFNLAAPDVRTEEVGAIIRVKTTADGGDYAVKNARYDYATLNHFADITDGTNTRGVTLSNSDCSFVKLGRSTPDKLDIKTAQLNVLAGGQVDGEGYGIRNQNGNTNFLHRFALRAHAAYYPVAAMKFSVEHQNPPVAGFVSGGTDNPYPEKTFSLLAISNPSVLLCALKPAEEGIAAGLIARAWNLGTAPAESTIATPALTSAHETTHVETNLAELPVRDGGFSASFSPQQMKTFRLEIKPSTRP